MNKNSKALKGMAIILIAVMVVATIAIGLSATMPQPIVPSSSGASQTESVSPVQNVNIAVLSIEGAVIAEKETAVVNTSVLAATKELLDEKQITYVEKNGNLMAIGEAQNTETQGWIITIDGAVPALSPAAIVLKDGAKVQWTWGELSAYPAPAEAPSSSSEAAAE